jgi:ribosomal protein S18 acetylase RimI-like enzyme
MRGLQIKKVGLTQENFKTIKNLHKLVFGVTENKISGIHWWLVFDREIPVAFASCYLTSVSCYFRYAGVIEGYRGRGIQRALINERIAFAKSKGCKYVYAQVEHDNIPSNNNFIRCKFMLIEPAKGHRHCLNWIRNI